MKLKYAIIAFVISSITIVAGALCKMMHWPGGEALLIGGFALDVTAIAMVILYLMGRNKSSDNPQ